MQLTTEQKDIIEKVSNNIYRKKIQTIGGYAGCGKTVVAKELADKFPKFAVCAFTGKASHRLRQKGVSRSQTIHSTIYNVEKDIFGNQKFILKEKWQLGAQGFICDEASMVPKTEHDNMLSYGLPIVYIGDHGQLEPVGEDIGIMKDPMYKLEKIHRNAGEIAEFAEHLRLGKDPRSFKCKEKVKIIESHEVTDTILANQDQILCAFNNFRVRLNDRMRKILGFNDEEVMPGEKIIFLANNRNDAVFNGMICEVVEVEHDLCRITVKTEEDKILSNLKYDPRQFGSDTLIRAHSRKHNLCDYGYVITGHKSQGSEFDRVLVYEQRCKLWEHIRWAYTTASRAKEYLTWVLAK